MFLNVGVIIYRYKKKKKKKLGSSNQEASPSSAGKNTGIILEPCWVWKCVPTAISGGVDIFEAPGCQLLKIILRMVFHKLTAYLSVFHLFLTQ